ncbi:hypothetical protein F0562_011695 [Nyssa sinensis]|uniref:Uncharacterized protein n=1 Tax=Nyssa sinensis TaxID=561372 RepID=A0A5J4ZV66_9ASTE|nr:hypothetical protein F0562_011695 [Nyssa sinensis]
MERIKSLEKNQSGGGDYLGSRSGHKSSRGDKGFRSSPVENDSIRKEKHDLHGGDDGLDAFRKLEDLYQSGRETVDGSRYGSREMMRNKRKVDDVNLDEQPEAKLRRWHVGKEVQHSGEQHKITKIESETDIRSYRDKDDQRRGDYSRLSRSGGGREDQNIERGARIHSRGDPHRESRRSDRDHGEHGGRRHGRDEEEHRGRWHTSDEGVTYRRHGKDEERYQPGSRRRGREEEEGRGSVMDGADGETEANCSLKKCAAVMSTPATHKPLAS